MQVEFRNKYQIPLILEESLTFGVLGETGRGATEHFGIDVRVSSISGLVDIDAQCCISTA